MASSSTASATCEVSTAQKTSTEPFRETKWIASYIVPCHITNDADIMLYAQDCGPTKIPLSPSLSTSTTTTSDYSDTDGNSGQASQPLLTITATKIGSMYGVDPRTNQHVLLRTVFYAPDLVMPGNHSPCQRHQGQHQQQSVVMFSIQQSIQDGCELQTYFGDGDDENDEAAGNTPLRNVVRRFATRLRSRQLNQQEKQLQQQQQQQQRKQEQIQIRRGKFCLRFYREQMKYENGDDCDGSDSSTTMNCTNGKNDSYNVFANKLMVELAASPPSQSPMQKIDSVTTNNKDCPSSGVHDDDQRDDSNGGGSETSSDHHDSDLCKSSTTTCSLSSSLSSSGSSSRSNRSNTVSTSSSMSRVSSHTTPSSINDKKNTTNNKKIHRQHRRFSSFGSIGTVGTSVSSSTIGGGSTTTATTSQQVLLQDRTSRSRSQSQRKKHRRIVSVDRQLRF